MMGDRPELIISFPSELHREDFVGWLCDGGGEHLYMDGPFRNWDTMEFIPAIVEFDYSDYSDHHTVHCYAERNE